MQSQSRLTQKRSRSDLHVHSRFSDRPSEWLLRRIGSAECYTKPQEVYDRAKAAGMDFITISDHNCIEGALEIAHHPDTFISCEVTTYFPDDNAKFHLLVTGISEAQFVEIDRLRVDICELRDYLVTEDIVHSLAHPLFRVNSKVSVEHIEKVILLFKRFEGINGTRDPRAADLVRAVFRNLNEKMIHEMADKHGIAPAGPEPWKKHFTGGSDDHGGLYIASAYTETPRVQTVDDYLDKLRQYEHDMGGSSGSSLALSHSFYQIARQYYDQLVNHRSGSRNDFISELFRQLIEPPKTSPTHSFGERVRTSVHDLFWKFKGLAPKSPERILVEDFSRLLSGLRKPNSVRGHEWTYAASCRICHQWAWIAVEKFLEKVRDGKLIEGLQTLSSLGPVSLSVIPYVAAFATQHKDEQFLKKVAQRFDHANDLVERSDRVAIVIENEQDDSPTKDELESMVSWIRSNGLVPTLISCQGEEPIVDMNVRNFSPVEYLSIFEDAAPTAFPPFLEIVSYLEQRKFREIVIATPGPMGVLAILAGRLLNIRCTILAQPRFSSQVYQMSDEPNLEELAEKYLAWLYDQVELIYSFSRQDRNAIAKTGKTVYLVNQQAQSDSIGQLAKTSCPNH